MSKKRSPVLVEMLADDGTVLGSAETMYWKRDENGAGIHPVRTMHLVALRDGTFTQIRTYGKTTLVIPLVGYEEVGHGDDKMLLPTRHGSLDVCKGEQVRILPFKTRYCEPLKYRSRNPHLTVAFL